jgi:hypothetical protein
LYGFLDKLYNPALSKWSAPLGYRGVVMRSLLQITMFFLSLGHWKAIHRKNGKAQDFPKGRWMKDEKAGAESPTGARSKLQ